MPHQNSRLYAAAQRVIDAGLANDDSTFTPARPVWTGSTADDLLQRFVNAPELGAASFTEKLGRQLADAPQETIQLAAELVHLLAPYNFGGTAKRDLLLTVLAFAPEPIQVPAELDAALDSGFDRAGTAYRTYRDRQLAWLVRFVAAWKALAPDARQNALKDPWAFRDVADSIPVNSAYSQRNVLLHLAFPDTFERIVSRRHKQLIIEGLADDLPRPTGDEDRDLAALRAELERQRGDHIDFYDSDIERRLAAVRPSCRVNITRQTADQRLRHVERRSQLRMNIRCGGTGCPTHSRLSIRRREPHLALNDETAGVKPLVSPGPILW